MIVVLRIAAIYNVIAGLAMIIFYHEGFEALGLEKTNFSLPIQLVGMMVALFGFGYWMVANDAVTNHNVLLLGMLSKLLGPLLACLYIARGILPPSMLIVFFFADIIYLVPFWLTWRRAVRLAGEKHSQPS